MRYSLLEEFVAKLQPHVEMKSEQCLMILGCIQYCIEYYFETKNPIS